MSQLWYQEINLFIFLFAHFLRRIPICFEKELDKKSTDFRLLAKNLSQRCHHKEVLDDYFVFLSILSEKYGVNEVKVKLFILSLLF